MESSVNLLSKSQNPVILSINRQTYLRKIKKEKINQDQIVEDPAIPGGDLPFFIKYFIILSIWSDSMINATICIVEPHFSQIQFLRFFQFQRDFQLGYYRIFPRKLRYRYYIQYLHIKMVKYSYFTSTIILFLLFLVNINIIL